MSKHVPLVLSVRTWRVCPGAKLHQIHLRPIQAIQPSEHVRNMYKLVVGANWGGVLAVEFSVYDRGKVLGPPRLKQRRFIWS